MKKIILASTSNVLMVLLPLVGNPWLMINYKILLIISGSIFMWMTQPAFTVEETSDKKSSDKLSVLLILSMSFISVVAPVIDWAYFKQHQSNFDIITVIGLLMIVVGLFFRAWAVRTLGEFFTPTVQIKREHQLITAGPYSIVRHPSYTGAFLSITGGAVLLESWIGFAIGCIAMTIAYYVRISIEENELSAHFGLSYQQYKHTTKRIIPFVW
jgi:protein-S-isoprenylcysteine O-methyltransferase Ste14